MNPRKLLVIVGLAMLLFGGISAWRALHPALSPEQQIASQVEGLSQAIQNRSVGNTAGYLAKEFVWHSTPKTDVVEGMRGAFYSWREVQLNPSGLQIEVNGERATSSGNFSLSFRPGPDAAPEVRAGKFKLFWELRDGQWKVVKAEGGENLAS